MLFLWHVDTHPINYTHVRTKNELTHINQLTRNIYQFHTQINELYSHLSTHEISHISSSTQLTTNMLETILFAAFWKLYFQMCDGEMQ